MNEILIYGEIGVDITFPDFAEALSEIEGDKLTIRLHSAGGSVSDGLAIYNRLKESNLDITFIIEGLSASMATVIAMAGKVIMPENAWLMVHKPNYTVQGNSDDLRKYADDLDSFEQTLINIYQAKTNLSTPQLQAMLKEEAWLNAEDALQLGFIDEVIEEQRAVASLSLKAFNSAPKAVKKLFKDKKINTKVKTKHADPKTETSRLDVIKDVFSPFESKYSTLLAKCLGNVECNADKSRELLLKELGKGETPIAGSGFTVEPVQSKSDRMTAYAEALACRHTSIKPGDEARGYMGKSLVDMGRDILESIGVNTRHMGAPTVIAKAMHSTSDFPSLLQGSGQRILMNAYHAVPAVIKQLASVHPFIPSD